MRSDGGSQDLILGEKKESIINSGRMGALNDQRGGVKTKGNGKCGKWISGEAEKAQKEAEPLGKH